MLSMGLLISEATRSCKKLYLESREASERLEFNVFPRKYESNPMNELEPLINLTKLDESYELFRFENHQALIKFHIVPLLISHNYAEKK